jgi:hypothetical protein
MLSSPTCGNRVTGLVHSRRLIGIRKIRKALSDHTSLCVQRVFTFSGPPTAADGTYAPLTHSQCGRLTRQRNTQCRNGLRDQMIHPARAALRAACSDVIWGGRESPCVSSHLT